MTDKEIITALGFCSDDEATCDLCPYYPHSERVMCCSTNMMRDTLRLITCQQSQIEDLKEALEERIERIKELEAEIRSDTAKMKIAADCIKRQGEEIERLKERLDAKYDICIERDKTAAIREFAERLEDNIARSPHGYTLSTLLTIDTLVKEMTEGES